MEVNVSLVHFYRTSEYCMDLTTVWLALSVCAYTNKKCYFIPDPAAFENHFFSLQIIL
jgi:hypothetical protein